MIKKGGEFVAELELKPNIYHYKYIVDGEWKYSKKDKFEVDNNGNINNVLLVAWSPPSPSHHHKVLIFFTLFLIVLRKDSINESNGVDLDYIKGSYNQEDDTSGFGMLNCDRRKSIEKEEEGGKSQGSWKVKEEWTKDESGQSEEDDDEDRRREGR